MDYPDDEELAFSAVFLEFTRFISSRENSVVVDFKPSDPGSLTMDVPARSTKTFLDLPENVQIRILQYAGLLRPCLVNVTFEQMRIKHNHGSCCSRIALRETRGLWSTFVEKPCDHPQLPMNLFLASRDARRHIASLFFSHNRFSALIYTKTDFQVFRSGTEWGMQHLRHLHLDLGPRDNRFLKIGGGIHRTVMGLWISFCKMAAENMRDLRCFSLKCKVRDLEVACRLMRAMDPFPTLAQCAIHLSQTQDDYIRPVVKRAVWRLTDNLGDKPPFPFLRLPKEVQLMILEQVLINQSDPYIQPSEWSRGIVTLQDRKRHRTTVWPLTCCGTCSPLQAMCFCHSRQTAYSTGCSCFSSPLPYFLVSRGIYEDARHIFFSKNNFAFVEEDPEFMMRFWHCIPTSSFMKIRHLTFKFPSSYRTPGKYAHRPEDSALISWAVLRRFILEHFDLPYLTITIVDLGTKNYLPNAVPNRNKYMRKLLKSFEDLHGIRDFRVYLADDRSFEKEVEKAVLGPVYVAGRTKPTTIPFAGKRGSSPHTSS